jgi:hypothetical protein
MQLAVAVPTRFLAAVCVLVLPAACASQSPDPPAAMTGTTSETLSTSAVSTPGLEQMKRGGPYMFSLDESDPSATFHAKCAKESGGDAAKADTCYAQIREEGSHEGMRFSLDAQQRIVWTSFGLEDGKEAIYLEGPLTIATDGQRGVVGTFAAPPHGLQMEGQTALPKKPIRFMFVDAKTMVMTDEVKGRLVFHTAN